MADVAVIIVTYNSAKCIRACLDSVIDQTPHFDLQLVVVDNNSADDTAQIVKTEYPLVEFIESDKNLGFAAGVNRGASVANAEFVLLLNPDTVILGKAIDALIGFARTHPDNGIYGGQTLRADGTLEPSSCWAFPTIWSMGMFACGLSTLVPHIRWFNPESMPHWNRNTVREVDIVTGCFLLTRTTTWNELKGLDERFFMYGEDVDFAFRGRAAGYRPIICPDAKIIHQIGESSARKLHKMRLLYRGKATLLRTHWKGIGRSCVLSFLLCGTALRAVLSIPKSLVSNSDATDDWRILWQERHQWIEGY